MIYTSSGLSSNNSSSVSAVKYTTLSWGKRGPWLDGGGMASEALGGGPSDRDVVRWLKSDWPFSAFQRQS